MTSALWILLAATLPPLSPMYQEAAEHTGTPPAVYVEKPLSNSRAAAATTARPHKRIFGYLPYWTTVDPNDLQWDVLTDVAHFSIEVGGQGQILDTHGWLTGATSDGATLVRIAHQHGAKAHLSAIVPGNIRGLLQNASSRAAAVKGLVDLVVRGKADGLNLDVEPVPATHGKLYLDFVKEVRAALDAAAPKTELTVCVYALPDYYPGYDIAELSKVASSLLVMSFNYYWPGSSKAGPTAPLEKGTRWTYSVAESFEPPTGHLAHTTPDKLMMGVPYFGHAWITESATEIPSKTKAYGKPRTYNQAMSRLGKATAKWDAISQTPYYGYSEGGEAHQLWFDNAKSLEAKYNYVNQLGLAGVMIWALGYDSAHGELWEALRQKFVRENPPPQTNPAPVPDAGAPSGEPPSNEPQDVPESSVAPLPATAPQLTSEEVRGGCHATSGAPVWGGPLLLALSMVMRRRAGRSRAGR